MSDGMKLVGLAGVIEDPDTLIHVAETVRDNGYAKWDCHTPYPVHGLEKAMGLPGSKVPRIALTGGLIGACVAMGMQWWMSASDYPVVIGGKEFFSWPAFVPITFELFVLFSAFTIMGCLVKFCRLGKWSSPLYDAGVMELVTRDKYAVVLESCDAKFDEKGSWDLLERAGCQDIRRLYESLEDEPLF